MPRCDSGLIRNIPMLFKSLPLHDAVLASAHVSWEAARCDLLVYPINLPVHRLTFEGFTNLEFPRNEPWGPSVSINRVDEPQPGTFEIELQSGDILRIAATHWVLSADTL